MAEKEREQEGAAEEIQEQEVLVKNSVESREEAEEIQEQEVIFQNSLEPGGGAEEIQEQEPGGDLPEQS